MSDIYENLDQLGRQTPLPARPEEASLERVPNPHLGTAYCVRFTCPEFTSLCPITSQPDFAHLVIDYLPGEWLVESKSLKLFLGSFRNHGAFHEDCTVGIAKTLVDFMSPDWLRISGYWYPRGGIPIDVFYQTGTMPEGVYVPETGVPPYRGAWVTLMGCWVVTLLQRNVPAKEWPLMVLFLCSAVLLLLCWCVVGW